MALEDMIFGNRVVDTYQELYDIPPCTLKDGEIYFVRYASAAYVWDDLHFKWVPKFYGPIPESYFSSVQNSKRESGSDKFKLMDKEEILNALEICLAVRYPSDLESKNRCWNCPMSEIDLADCMLVCRDLLKSVYNLLKDDPNET